MSIFKARGIIIKEVLVGDNDKSVAILGKDYGKIWAWVRNCRSSKSKLLAGSTLFSYADFVIYDNGKSLALNEIDIIESFYTLRQELDTLAYGTYFLEFIEKNIQEGIPVNDIMLLLLKSLQILMKNGQISPKLIAKIFEIKFLQLNGYMPIVDNCSNCNKNIIIEDKIFWGINGSLCENCKHTQYLPLKINKNILFTVNYILTSDINNLYNFSVSDEGVITLSLLSKKLLNEFLNTNLKSESFIQQLEKLI